MSADEVDLIQSIFKRQIVEAEQLIRESANILSELTIIYNDFTWPRCDSIIG